jgi:hypothetical protein
VHAAAMAAAVDPTWLQPEMLIRQRWCIHISTGWFTFTKCKLLLHGSTPQPHTISLRTNALEQISTWRWLIQTVDVVYTRTFTMLLLLLLLLLLLQGSTLQLQMPRHTETPLYFSF